MLMILGLGGCGSLEDSLAPDPQLLEQESPVGMQPEKPNLPADFPKDVPLYPEARLLQAQPNSTVWAIADDVAQLEKFYRDKLTELGWEITTGQTTEESFSELIATKENREITLTLPTNAPAPAANSDRAVVGTTFVLSYRSLADPPADQATAPEESPTPDPPDNPDNSPPKSTTQPKIDDQVQDLITLGVFSRDAFQGNNVISRRQFARWLLTAHNKIYGDRPNQQIRLATATSEPVFTDMPPSDPDFAEIQGLAEAGIIPSILTNNTNSPTFRPDDPLTRETLLAWKVPLDRRQALPPTTLDQLAQTWGFQDAAKIDSRAVQALYIDFQNGDKSNVRRVFGYTTLFQPAKNVTQQEAAIAIWYFGFQGEGKSAE